MEPIDFVAEIGSNHAKKDGDGLPSLDRALTLIDEAAGAGATTVKFQLFTGDELHSDPKMVAELDRVALPESWLPTLANTAKENRVEFLCTPFSPRAVGVLEDYVKRWKIASWDITYIPLLHAIRESGKPIILSTAGATIKEIELAIEILRPGDEFPGDITLLHCHAGYPIKLEQYNMRRMLDLVGAFTVDLGQYHMMEYGISTHCTDPIVNAATVILGAQMIEAHFDLPGGKGIEEGHSLDPIQFKQMVSYAEKFQLALGPGIKHPSEDRAVGMYRRSEEDWLRPLKRG